MIKRFINTICILAILQVVIPYSIAAGADWSAGLMSYYSWWKPAFRSFYDNYKIEPLFLYGPVVNVSFNSDVSLSLLAITSLLNPSVIKSNASYDRSFSGGNGEGFFTFDTDMQRLDVDLALSYKINASVSIYGGYKLLIAASGHPEGEITKGSYTFDDGNASLSDMHGQQNMSHGMGVGCNYKKQVLGNTWFSIGTSLLLSKTSVTLTDFNEVSTGIIEDNNESYTGYTGFGNNTTLSITYFIQDISLSISLGGRYQFIKYFSSGDNPDMAEDHFGGITLSVIYNF